MGAELVVSRGQSGVRDRVQEASVALGVGKYAYNGGLRSPTIDQNWGKGFPFGHMVVVPQNRSILVPVHRDRWAGYLQEQPGSCQLRSSRGTTV